MICQPNLTNTDRPFPTGTYKILPKAEKKPKDRAPDIRRSCTKFFLTGVVSRGPDIPAAAFRFFHTKSRDSL